MGAPRFAPFGVEKSLMMETISFNKRCKTRVNMLLPIIAICFFTWLLIISTVRAPHLCNELIEYEYSPVSSATTQLFNLQDQLSTRMAQHHEIMSSNLEKFNSILTNITHMADQSFWHLNFVRNLLVLGSSSIHWGQAAALLVDAKEKLRNYDLDDIHLRLETLAQSANIMDAEMKDMEVFLLDIENKLDKLVAGLTTALHDEDEQHQAGGSLLQSKTQSLFSRLPFFGGSSFNGIPFTPLAAQPLRWTWDVIVDGKVHPTYGEFTQAQKMQIQSFLTDNNVSLPLPTTITYGMGLPDTGLPQHTPMGGLLFVASSGGATITDSSQYICDIAAYFKEQPVEERWLSSLLGKYETRMEKELIAVQSMICWNWDGERVHGRDVVRERI